jgi:multiple sugar transport system ATP-binding protein
MATVRIEELTKTYRGGVGALRGLSVTIADGEFACVLGPSGSGKSTLLKLIAGIEEPTSGRVFLGERDVTRVTPERRDVAMVFQSYALYAQMSVAENIGFPLKIRKVARREREARVKEVAALLGLADQLRRHPRELSGGERQRVALGRAIIRRPRAFLLDEPLSNLDANLRVAMRQELKRLQTLLGATFIYVTHDQDDALAMGDRVIVLAHGELQQCASASELYKYPANRFVASFIGRLPMNFFEGTATFRPDGVSFATQFFAILLPGSFAEKAGETKQAVLGVRPEALQLRAGHDGAATAPSGTVQWLEVVQPDTYATVAVGSQTVLAKVLDDQDIAAQSPVSLVMQPHRVHLFDVESGRRLNPAPKAAAAQAAEERAVVQLGEAVR